MLIKISKKFLITLMTYLSFFVISYFFINIFSDPKNTIGELQDANIAQDINKLYGFDKPLIIQFLNYIANVFHGDFGPILGVNKGFVTIPGLFFGPLKITWAISFIAFVISLFLGYFLGVVAAFKANSPFDFFITIFVLIFSASPIFVFAPIIILTVESFGGYPIYEGNFGQRIEVLSLIAPTIILTLASLTSLTYIVKNEVQGIIISDQYLFAKSKGLSAWKLFYYHIFKNSLVPIIALLPPLLLSVITSSILIETIFAIPGNSSIIFSSVKNGEIFIALFTVNFYVLVFYVLVFIAEIILILMLEKQKTKIEFKLLKRLMRMRRFRNGKFKI